MKTTFYLIAMVLYPGESVWEEHGRVPVFPSTQQECDKQLRLAGNAVDAAPLQVMFQCYDESAPVTDYSVSDVAGYSLEKYLPAGAKHTAKSKESKSKATGFKRVNQ